MQQTRKSKLLMGPRCPRGMNILCVSWNAVWCYLDLFTLILILLMMRSFLSQRPLEFTRFSAFDTFEIRKTFSASKPFFFDVMFFLFQNHPT